MWSSYLKCCFLLSLSHTHTNERLNEIFEIECNIWCCCCWMMSINAIHHTFLSRIVVVVVVNVSFFVITLMRQTTRLVWRLDFSLFVGFLFCFVLLLNRKKKVVRFDLVSCLCVCLAVIFIVRCWIARS